MRCKTMTLPGKITDVKELKEWNFDGSSTKQAPGHDSDVFLVSSRWVTLGGIRKDSNADDGLCDGCLVEALCDLP
jgi:hypothetical protein